MSTRVRTVRRQRDFRCARTPVAVLSGSGSVDAVRAQRYDLTELLAYLDRMRTDMGLSSMSALAEAAGISHVRFTRWRQGAERPSVDSLRLLAGVFGIDPRILWDLAGITEADGTTPAARVIPPQITRLLDLYDTATSAEKVEILERIEWDIEAFAAKQQLRRLGEKRRAIS